MDWNEQIEEFDSEKKVKTSDGSRLTTIKAVNEITKSMMQVVASINGDQIIEELMPKIRDKVEKEIGLIPKRVEIKMGDKPAHEIKGVTHEVFPEVLKFAARGIPVYLTGPAGSGKNVICKQVADALGLEFYFTNAVTEEYKLTGFIDANGVYRKTQFYDAFTKGGLFFLDEMDASVPETLVILNAAIANGYFNFPNGKFNAHRDFHVIAAGNTLGTGADLNYTGRYSLDRATLNRFAVVKVNYSPKIEESIAGDNKPLLQFVRDFRKARDKAGVECILSYRQLSQMNAMKDDDIELDELVDAVILKGLDIDSLNTMSENLDKNSANPYTKAFFKVKENRKKEDN